MSNEVKLNHEIYDVVVVDNEWMCDIPKFFKVVYQKEIAA